MEGKLNKTFTIKRFPVRFQWFSVRYFSWRISPWNKLRMITGLLSDVWVMLAGVIRHGAERYIDCGDAALWKKIDIFVLKGGTRCVQSSLWFVRPWMSKPLYRSFRRQLLTLVYGEHYNLNHTYLRPLSATL